MRKISFVIPVYRNKGSLAASFENIVSLFKKRFPQFTYEIIFIDDGSDDGSNEELDSIHRKDSNVQVISFTRNFGQVAAIVAGFKAATGDACIWMAADLQEPIEKVAEMIHEWTTGTEIVVCYRTEREDGVFANYTSRLFYRLIHLGNRKIPLGGFDFALLDRKALNALNLIDERNRFLQGDILWLGFNVKFIPYSREKRTIGKSQWKLSKKLKYFIDGFLNTSYWPIRAMSFIGMISALTGFFYALVIVYSRLIHQTPFSGWAPIMILILVIGGLIMIMLGIIGEYLWRIYDESRKRPLFIIKRHLK